VHVVVDAHDTASKPELPEIAGRSGIDHLVPFHRATTGLSVAPIGRLSIPHEPHPVSLLAPMLAVHALADAHDTPVRGWTVPWVGSGSLIGCRDQVAPFHRSAESGALPPTAVQAVDEVQDTPVSAACGFAVG
jgi:hypothetical protein